MTTFFAIVRREWLLAMRRMGDGATLLFFFIVVASLFPLGTGADWPLLHKIGPGVLWVTALLATLLSLNRLFAEDYADGTLEQLALSPTPFGWLVAGKILAHWSLTGLPIVLFAPLLGLQYGLPWSGNALLMLSLLLGTPILSLLGAIGAALTLGLRDGGALLALLVLPLYAPVLVFGSGATLAQLEGLDASGHLALLAAMLAVAIVLAPLAATAALRIALE